MKTINKIDVHHHIFPLEYLDALKEVGVVNSIGVEFPKWNAAISLKKMKENGIKVAMLSISTPGVYPSGIDLSSGFPEKLARICNEIISDTKKQYPENFGGFATIPLLNEKAAIDELNYAMDTLQLDGVCLMTNYMGKYLGDASFDAFFKELNKRKALVFIHPTDPGEDLDAQLGFPNALIDAPFETTRAVTNLMHKGVLDHYPGIRYILAHGGGTIPYIAWRMAAIEYAQEAKKTPVMRTLYDFLAKGEPAKGLQLLRNMYYDTTHVSGSYAMKTLQSFAGPDHVVFGSDLCISKLAGIVTRNITKDGEFSNEEFTKMAYGNCLSLFPAFAELFKEQDIALA